MKLSRFYYELPSEFIAKYPLPHRDDSRLMVLNRKNGKIEHKEFKDVINYFSENDVLVLNNTKVFPAKLYGKKEKTGADIEVFLLRELNKDEKLWDVLVDPARKIRIGNKLFFGENNIIIAEVIDNTTSRGRTLRFLYDGPYDEFKSIIDRLGKTPLPAFLERPAEDIDAERYQTIYAKEEGAIAAPTAGMHFSKQLFKRFEIKGVDFSEITLHIGLGNFRKVEVEDLTKHKMDSEQIKITQDVADFINTRKKEKRQICSVGTTVMRALESSVSVIGELKPYEGWTNRFIFPPYVFNVPTSMITNFHLPQSTVMMTVAAFAGYELLMEAYEIAKEEKYRFGTYGDAMLVL